MGNRMDLDGLSGWATSSLPFQCHDGHRELAPVASFPEDANQLFDVFGNVRELTESQVPDTEARIVCGPSFASADTLDSGILCDSGGGQPRLTHGLRLVLSGSDEECSTLND